MNLSTFQLSGHSRKADFWQLEKELAEHGILIKIQKQAYRMTFQAKNSNSPQWHVVVFAPLLLGLVYWGMTIPKADDF